MDQSPKNDIHIPFVDAKCKMGLQYDDFKNGTEFFLGC